MKLQKGQKLLFIGDSISDTGRAQPVGEGRDDALGQSYVRLVNALLQVTYQDLGVRVVNMGTSGHTTRDLLERWTQDVLEQHPDWLAIYIGINDVWRQFDCPEMTETHIGLAEYEANLEKMIAMTPNLSGLMLLTPHIMEPNRQDPMRARMDEYGAVVKRLAEKHGAVLVDVQAAFDQLFHHRHPMSVAWDRIHPDQKGQMLIAKTILNAFDFNWDGQL